MLTADISKLLLESSMCKVRLVASALPSSQRLRVTCQPITPRDGRLELRGSLQRTGTAAAAKEAPHIPPGAKKRRLGL